ncbi:MAG: BREX-2 system adenine-specific DNA-methyltransferase PglX, partial [Planctomycetes bacterium]|nr:BREX-2 system adenine-specific DNA-methyltransferase PglX [Planctomycetota bacterium]
AGLSFTCHMKYSLAIPFMEHIFTLCTTGGFTGQITANSFMKREFGKKIIEQFFPVTDLTHVIDTSGAYIPGHGTPTVILFGRRRQPVDATVRTVMGIRGEPSTPNDPALGHVWTAIVTQVDQPGSQSDFVSVADTPRATFHAHPWSIGGGGASELKEVLDETSENKLESLASSIGITSFTLEDDIFLLPTTSRFRSGINNTKTRPMIVGDVLRDWHQGPVDEAVFPYDDNFKPIADSRHEPALRYLWLARTCLANNKMFGGKTKVDCGMRWYEYGRLTTDKLCTPLSITYGEIATHNHFVLDRGGKVFNRTAPVIKLSASATEDDHLALLGILNSSTACFWMKQVCFPKTTATGDISTEKGKPEAKAYAFSGTALGSLPIPSQSTPTNWVKEIARRIDALVSCKASLLPGAVIKAESRSGQPAALKDRLRDAAADHALVHRQIVALQEELDWETYKTYQLSSDGACELVLSSIEVDRLGIAPTARPFAWVDEKPPVDVPIAWRDTYRLRRGLLRTTPALALIETLVYKRPWWGRQGVYGRLARDYEGWQAEAVESFLLDRLERFFDFDGRMNDAKTPTATLPLALVSIGDLATAARRDPLFIEAAEVFTGDVAFDVTALIMKLVDQESVPLLPILRYKPTGSRKHAEWQGVWDLQRQEDAIDARASLDPKNPAYVSTEQAADMKRKQVGDIAVPPKYTSADFLKTHYWRLRGKLDVPKERFVSFPHILGPDGTPMIAWAGLDQLQLAKAIGDFYGMVQTEYGGSDDPRLVPMLANLCELLPWVRQWHAESLPDYGGPPAAFYEQFIRDEATSKSLTWDQIREWTPPVATRAKKVAKKATKRATKKKPGDEESPNHEGEA